MSRVTAVSSGCRAGRGLCPWLGIWVGERGTGAGGEGVRLEEATERGNP